MIGLLRRAVALLGPDTPEAVELLPDLVSALHEAGAFDEAEAIANRALEVSTRLGLARPRARAAIEQARMRLCRHPGAFDPGLGPQRGVRGDPRTRDRGRRPRARAR